MKYLNYNLMASADPEAFWSTKPFPAWNPEGFLTEEGYRTLLENMPPVEMFSEFIGVKRRFGQKPHDRFLLAYRQDLKVAPCWHEFVRELKGKEYQSFLARMLRAKNFRIRLHWHYATTGNSVSPHADAMDKFGSQIFYFNTDKDWKDSWGGQTLMLDDEGKMDYRSNPDFSDFKREIPSVSLGNHSFLFARLDHSWHGVKPLTCPPGTLRKIFTVVIEQKPSVWKKWNPVSWVKRKVFASPSQKAVAHIGYDN